LDENTSFSYSGQKLSLQSLISKYDCLHVIGEKDQKNKFRKWVHCTVCKEFESAARRHSRTGLVPMATGIRVDGQEKIKRIVDHLNSKPHQSALQAKQLQEMWKKQSVNHPWVKTLSKHDSSVINFLICLAIDVYNDSLMETLPAWN
jgi:hypothetical protein